MTPLVALSVSIGLLGGIATILFTSIGLALWAGFIAWACFYHSGADTNAFKQTLVGNIFGAVCAWIAAFLIVTGAAGFASSLGNLWTAIVVAVTVGAMCLAAHVKALSNIPASVYGYASTFAYLLLNVAAMVIAELTAMDYRRNPLLFVVSSMVLGAVFGLASKKLADALTKKA